MAVVTQQHQLSTATRERGGLDYDYFDSFLLTSEDLPRYAPRDWARAVEKAAGLGGTFIWKGILQLRAPAHATERLSSWSVVHEGPDWLTLRARSWTLTATVVLEVEEQQVRATLLVGYDRPPARVIWPVLAPVHRRLMPGLLRHTLHVLRAGQVSPA